MPRLTLTEKSKATTKHWFSRDYDNRPGNRVGLFWDTHMLACLLTYLLRTDTGQGPEQTAVQVPDE